MKTTTHRGIPIHRLVDFKEKHMKFGWQQPESFVQQLSQLNGPHFSIFSTSLCKEEISAHRRDFYKITYMMAGTGRFTIGHRQYEIKPPSLIFVNPYEVKTWQATSEEQDGYFCLFNEAFFGQTAVHLQDLKQYPHFLPGAPAVFNLQPEQAAIVEPLFLKMVRENESWGPFRQEILCLTLRLLMAEAKRFSSLPTEASTQNNAAYQITLRFLNQLERQFPIVSKSAAIGIKTPSQFAVALAVHPNHLNACVKETTGKTVREHIQNRMLAEALTLLKFTDWRVSEIAYSLGFEEPASFIHFFKKETGQPPLAFRD